MSFSDNKKNSKIVFVKFYLCFGLLLIGLPNKVLSQNDNQKTIDSLLTILNNDTALADKPGLLYQLSELSVNIDSSVALNYAKKGLEIARRNKDEFQIAKGEFTLGGVYLDYSYRKQAKERYMAADSILSRLKKIDSSERVLKLWVRSNFNVGVVVSYEGNFEQIKYLEKITPIAEKIGFYDILSTANTNLAIDFYNANQYNKAYEYFLKSEGLYRKSKNQQNLTIDRLIFSSCLVEMDSLTAADRELTKLRPVLDSAPKNNITQLYYQILGQYNHQAGKYPEALENYKKAEDILKSNLTVSNDLQLYMDIMQTYGEMGDYKNASLFAQRCLKLASEANNQVLVAEIYKQLSTYKNETGKVDEAYGLLVKYVSISDSLNYAELEKEVNRLESRYQSEKKEREILQLKNDKNNVELLLANKRSQNYFLLAATMGLLIIAIITYFGYRNFRKSSEVKTTEINRLKYEQESKVYNAMLEGQENERKRLAIDLHDGLAGRLSATRIKLEKMAKKNANQKTEKDFKEAAGNIDESLSELRGIAMNLMPETLFKYGLKTAIEDYCSSIGSSLDDVKFILQFYDADEKLPNNVALTIYRIIQELINNAVKHAKASEVLVQYIIENDTINITVEDNGKGFDGPVLDSRRGMGLNNLKTRVAYLNGEIEFDSSPNEGTNVHIVIDC